MEVIKDYRQTGRTTKLLKRAHELGGYVICIDRQEVTRVANIARELGLNIPYPMTFDEYINQRFYSRGVKRVHIDNFDYMVQRILAQRILVNTVKVPIETITLELVENPSVSIDLWL